MLEPHSYGAGSLCGKCGDAPFFAARSCGLYTGTLEASILFLKTHPHPHLCARLRSIVAVSLVENREALAADLLIPIPLARSRKRERGYNQASVIAKTLSPVSGISLDERSLIRARYTERHRAGMDAKDRARSLHRAFKVVRPEVVRGSSVLLVDDLYTTGSTATSAAAALLEAGATRVSLFTIARVVASGTVYIQ
jgi:ComF family protein